MEGFGSPQGDAAVRLDAEELSPRPPLEHRDEHAVTPHQRRGGLSTIWPSRRHDDLNEDQQVRMNATHDGRSRNTNRGLLLQARNVLVPDLRRSVP